MLGFTNYQIPGLIRKFQLQLLIQNYKIYYYFIF